MTLFVSDLDGTLLHPDGYLTDASRAAIERVLAAGVPFTVASARSWTSIRDVLGPLPLRLPVIAFNGGFISDYATGRHLHTFALDPGAARRTYNLGAEVGLTPLVSTTTPGGDRVVIRRPYLNDGVRMYAEARLRVRDPRLRFVDDPRPALDQTVTCLTFIGQRARLVPLSQQLLAQEGALVEPHLFDDLYTTGWAWITVHSKRARKDLAVQTLRGEHGLTGRPWVAFGDQGNDLAMLQAADHGVAVADAIPALRAVADEVIGPASEDSVARYLLDRLRLR